MLDTKKNVWQNAHGSETLYSGFVTTVTHQDHRGLHPATEDDLLLLDDDNEEAEEYNWYNEPLANGFDNLEINRIIDIDLE